MKMLSVVISTLAREVFHSIFGLSSSSLLVGCDDDGFRGLLSGLALFRVAAWRPDDETLTIKPTKRARLPHQTTGHELLVFVTAAEHVT